MSFILILIAGAFLGIIVYAPFAAKSYDKGFNDAIDWISEDVGYDEKEMMRID